MTKEGKKKKSPEEQGKEDCGKIEDEKSQEKERLLPKVGKESQTEAIEEAKKDEGMPKEKIENQKKNGGEVIKEPGEKPEVPPAKPNPSVQLPPEEVVLKVFMHCEGCAKKVRKSLRGLKGVEDVKTDCKTNTVVVKGKAAAQDPKNVAETIYRRSGKRVLEILSPAPGPHLSKNVAVVEMLEKKKQEKTNQKKEPEKTGVVVLKVYMHCEACAEEIKRRILKLSGVQTVETTLVTSQVKVMGNFDPDDLVKYLYKRTGKHAFIVKQEQILATNKPAITEDAKPASDSKPESKQENAKENEKKEQKTEEKPKEENMDQAEGSSTATLVAVVDPGDGGKGNGDQHNCYYFPRFPMEYSYPYPHPYQYPYSDPPPPQYQYSYMPPPPPPPPPPPQIFSDENPNACIVM